MLTLLDWYISCSLWGLKIVTSQHLTHLDWLIFSGFTHHKISLILSYPKIINQPSLELSNFNKTQIYDFYNSNLFVWNQTKLRTKPNFVTHIPIPNLNLSQRQVLQHHNNASNMRAFIFIHSSVFSRRKHLLQCFGFAVVVTCQILTTPEARSSLTEQPSRWIDSSVCEMVERDARFWVGREE